MPSPQNTPLSDTITPDDLRLAVQQGALDVGEYERALSFLGIRPTGANWAHFWQRILLVAGLLFIVAGVICFFAWNWADMSHFTKFGLIIALIGVSAAVPLWKGLDSLPGGLGLLGCGLFIGPLLAVFGQYYQTGADAWELFRAWAMVLLPLAAIGRKNGLWLAFWIVGSLAFGLYLQQTRLGQWESLFTAFSLPEFLIAQCLALFVWEVATRQAKNRPHSFLHAPWPARILLACLLWVLTILVMQIVARDVRWSLQGASMLPVRTTAWVLYAGIMAGGFALYRFLRPDILNLAMGLSSLIVLFVWTIFQVRRLQSSWGLFSGALLILSCAYVATKILMRWYARLSRKERQERDAHTAGHDLQASLRALIFTRRHTWQELGAYLNSDAIIPPNRAEKEDHTPHMPWYINLIHTLSAWAAAGFLIVALYMFIDFLHMEIPQLKTYKDISPVIGALLGLAVGVPLSHISSLFVRRFGLTLALAGGLLLPVSINIMLDTLHWWQWPVIATGCLVFLLFRQPLLRCLAVLAILGGILAFTVEFCYTFASAIGSYGGGMLDTSQIRVEFLIPYALSLLIFIPLGLTLARGWCHEADWIRNARKDAAIRPALHALAVVFLIAGGVIATASPSGWSQHYTLWIYLCHHCGIGAGFGLCFLALCIGRQTPEFSSRKGIFYLGALAAAGAGYWLPWLTVGIFLLALARFLGSAPFAGLVIAYLVACIHWFYYSLQSTLLDKAYSLCAVGIIMFIFGYTIHKMMPDLPHNGALTGGSHA